VSCLLEAQKMIMKSFNAFPNVAHKWFHCYAYPQNKSGIRTNLPFPFANKRQKAFLKAQRLLTIFLLIIMAKKNQFFPTTSLKSGRNQHTMNQNPAVGHLGSRHTLHSIDFCYVLLRWPLSFFFFFLSFFLSKEGKPKKN